MEASSVAIECMFLAYVAVGVRIIIAFIRGESNIVSDFILFAIASIYTNIIRWDVLVQRAGFYRKRIY